MRTASLGARVLRSSAARPSASSPVHCCRAASSTSRSPAVSLEAAKDGHVQHVIGSPSSAGFYNSTNIGRNLNWGAAEESLVDLW